MQQPFFFPFLRLSQYPQKTHRSHNLFAVLYLTTPIFLLVLSMEYRLIMSLSLGASSLLQYAIVRRALNRPSAHCCPHIPLESFSVIAQVVGSFLVQRVRRIGFEEQELDTALSTNSPLSPPARKRQEPK